MKDYTLLLNNLSETGNLRSLPDIIHTGKRIEKNGRKMINFSSNDYLGLASRQDLQSTFLSELKETPLPFSSSSSRLLTGNYAVCTRLEKRMAERFGREAALLFNSGYHANTGILPALADKQTLILADKWIHASMIDGILLSGAPFRRYRHNDYEQLERLVARYADHYEQLIIVTESIFSMDGDTADLPRLVALKKSYKNICLYVDEAHAVGVRGKSGLGLTEEADCISDIDFLVGTFGKALASMGAYVLCDGKIRDYLINTVRSLIFSTALPPVQMAWTLFIFNKLEEFSEERKHLSRLRQLLAKALEGKGGEISRSHIIPYIIGENTESLRKAEELQRKGFYCLPVRPPTVPSGTARIRFSLTANLTEQEVRHLIRQI